MAKLHGLAPHVAVEPDGVEIVKDWEPSGASGAIETWTSSLVVVPARGIPEMPVPLNPSWAPIKFDPVTISVNVAPRNPATGFIDVTDGWTDEYTENNTV